MSSTDCQDDWSIRDLRKAIPDHCFCSSYIISFSYLVRDIACVITLAVSAASLSSRITNPYVYVILWCLYGLIQGLFGTGLWILGHECGHGALFPSQRVNDLVGFCLHSMLFTPYFSWKSTHRRHHMYANHMERDNLYVPYRLEAYAAKLGVDTESLGHLTSDTPGFTALRILIQQLFGWPGHILFYSTSGPESMHPRKHGKWWQNSHFDPTSPLFSLKEFWSVIISDIGIGLTVRGLWLLSRSLGSKTTILLYVVPWIWVNNWIVAITFLQHNHPSVPRYERNSWTFTKGALSTIDRDFGWAGRFFFHNVIDFHVVHHLFSQIPFYYAEEATCAITPILKSRYQQDRASSFIKSFWITFTECQWVRPVQGGNEGELWFQNGPSTAPRLTMHK